ncbi:MAG: HDOD domain-containing protein [Planctomycetes bacterium]|nr:HDOD domain-containing protein [Planctomycetota bacterium]
MSRIDAILAKIGGIQPLPNTVLRLVMVVNDPSSTVNDIVEVIKYDQAVTGQILRICNSAYFGLSREVRSLNEAIRYLGMIKVLQLVMAVHTNALLSTRQPGYELAPGMLWKHSVAVALAASAFAERMALDKHVSTAFTAGLLHDVGKVVLSEHVAADFAKIMDLVANDKVSFIEAEQAVLGISHCEVGTKVARTWQLPEQITQSIQFHHSPNEVDPPDPVLDAVYLGNTVCLMMGVGLGTDGLSYRADAAVVERHGLTESDLEFIGAQMMVDLKHVEQSFGDAADVKAGETSGVR